MKPGLRSRIAKKASKHLRAQGETPVPEIKDEETPPTAGPDEGVDEEEIEEEVREEKEEEVQLEELGDKLDELSETNETIVDALGDIKEVLKEEDEDGDDDVEEEFKNMQEEDEDEFTSEEFGINPENLVVSKEDKLTVGSSLRKARKERLGMLKKAQPYKDLSDNFEYDKAKSKSLKPKIPSTPNTKVKTDPAPAMLKLSQMGVDLSKDKKKWVVFQNVGGVEKPICEIQVTPETAKKFATKEFGLGILKAMKTEGILKALKKYNAKKYATKKVAKKVATKTPIEPQASINDLERRFIRAFRLALTAMNKNLKHNPLKEALFESLDGLGVEASEATNLIEGVFHKASMEHFEAAIVETEKYLELSDDAFIELEATVGDMQTETPRIAASSGLSERAAAIRARAAKNSLPLSTASSYEVPNMAEQIKRALPKPRLYGVDRHFRK